MVSRSKWRIFAVKDVTTVLWRSKTEATNRLRGRKTKRGRSRQLIFAASVAVRTTLTHAHRLSRERSVTAGDTQAWFAYRSSCFHTNRCHAQGVRADRKSHNWGVTAGYGRWISGVKVTAIQQESLLKRGIRLVRSIYNSFVLTRSSSSTK